MSDPKAHLTYTYVDKSTPAANAIDPLISHQESLASHLDALGTSCVAVTVSGVLETARAAVRARLEDVITHDFPALDEKMTEIWLTEY